jgi:hypothetical protein
MGSSFLLKHLCLQNLLFLIGKRSILLEKCKAPLGILEIYKENT